MRAINKTDIEIGNSDIAVTLYSAIDEETHFKQISTCCNSAVNYKKVCSGCFKELNTDEIKKALEVGCSLKEVDTDKIKLDNGNLKILGLMEDTEENGVFKDGSVWFIGIDEDKKNKAKTERNVLKFSYLRESLKLANYSLVGLITTRGKEHICLLKPYFKGIVGMGIYHFDRIRDIKEISGYSLNCNLNPEMLNSMCEQLKQKEKVLINQIENKRAKLIEQALTEISEINKTDKTEENLIELMSF